MNGTLKGFLHRARSEPVTPEASEEQRINFAYGNAGEGDEGSKDAVRAAATIMRATEKKLEAM